uniref:Peptidase C1A papain C-terminal domain-containing protein n=1 Tax=Plectus sambesii TaxID=2011161 RepID=A0A914VH34_9BILA
MVEKINKDSTNLWKARYNPSAHRSTKMPNASSWPTYLLEERWRVVDKIRNMEFSPQMIQHRRQLFEFVEELPMRFDAREKWPHCQSIATVPDQGACGSCWAVAATAAMSDRVCIHSNGTNAPILSVQDVLSCCEYCGNCVLGGTPMTAFIYWIENGIVSGTESGCKPYNVSLDCGHPCTVNTYETTFKKMKCEKSCQTSYHQQKTFKDDKVFGSLAYKITWQYPWVKLKMEGKALSWNERIDEFLDIVKREIYLFGPIVVELSATEELLLYASGVYHHPHDHEKRTLYSHIVRIIGWDTEHNDTNWLAVNSWGPQWGDYGLFRIRAKSLHTNAAFGFQAALPRS